MTDLRDQLHGALSNSYSIDRELGGGGMSRVFVAEERALGRQVVVKVLPAELAEEVSTERFKREIQVAARLQHPLVVPVLSTGSADGLLYYTMPLVQGESLRNVVLQRGALPVAEAVRLLKDIAEALAYAHAQGIVHRDIKPENVLVSNGHALVTDFGIAKAISAATSAGGGNLTTAGVALGTPHYMAPEQIAAEPTADQRVDVYAFGAVAFEVLTGRAPFDGLSRQALIAAHISTVPPRVSSVRKDVPAALDDLVAQCLEKDPAKRPLTGGEIAAVLETLTTGPQAAAAPARRSQRRTIAFVASGVALLALGAAATVRMRDNARGLDQNVVAVMPFRVKGADPSLAYLREGMVDLLAAKLTGEGGPRAADARATLSAWQRNGGSDSNDPAPDKTTSIGESVGAGRIISGTVVGTPKQVTLSAVLQRTSNGSEEGRAEISGSADTLTGLVDALVGKLLIVSAGQHTRLSERTTPSLEALRSYLDGRRLVQHGDYERAASAFEDALRRDSAFALAAMGKSIACGYVPGGCGGIPWLKAAHDGASRLSARDLVILRAREPAYPDATPRSIRLKATEDALAVASDSPDLWFYYGDVLLHYGTGFRDDATARARAAFERAIAIDSTFGPALEHLVHITASTGDTAAMRRFSVRYLSQDSTSETAPFFRWQMARMLGSPAERSRLVDMINSMPRLSLLYVAFFGAMSNIAGGPDSATDRAAERLLSMGTSPAERAEILRQYYTYQVGVGRPSKAASILRAIRDVGRGDTEDAVVIWSALFDNASQAEARNTVAAIRGRVFRAGAPPLERRDGTCELAVWGASTGDASLYTTARARLQTGMRAPSARIRDAATQCTLMADALRSAQARLPDLGARVAALDSNFALNPVTPWLDEPAVVLASTLEAAGQFDRAYAIARRHTQAVGSGHWPALARIEGRAAARLGKKKEAIDAYRRYLSFYSYKPEPVMQPDIDAVRAELRKLEGG